jgi:hypothetical protein
MPARVDRETACPACGQPMTALVLPRKLLGEVTIDLCGGCQVLWFDSHESLQLTPGATLQLFAAIHEARPAERRPLPERMACPRCRFPLARTQDLQRTTRFTYYRCEAGHGRLTPFFQFLREKDFVRPLPPAELDRLKAHVRIVRCSSCGAPIDLERQTACSYCRAPIAILDPDAVRRTIAALQTQEAARGTVDIDTLVTALLDARRERDRAELEAAAGTARTPLAVDLVDLGLSALAALLGPGR